MTDLKWKKVGDIIYAGIKPHRGRTKWVSMKTDNWREAKRKASESKLFKLQAIASANALTSAVFEVMMGETAPRVNTAIEKFLENLGEQGRPERSVAEARTLLLFWMRNAGTANLCVADLGQQHFTAFFNPGDGSKLKPLQKRQYICTKFCDFCADRGWFRGNPARGVGIDRSKLTQEQRLTVSHKPVTKEELDKLLVFAATLPDPFWYFAILFAWEHGLRMGDITSLEKVNVVDNELRLMTSKTNTFVRVPLTEAIVAALSKLAPPTNDAEKNFLMPKERAMYNLWGAAPFSDQFKKICNQAGVVGKTFHGLRTAYINRTYLENNESILKRMAAEMAKEQTAAQAGHRSTHATDIYLAAGGNGPIGATVQGG